MTEIDVLNHEGHYRITSTGKVISLKRGRRILRPKPHSRGYHSVTLSRNGVAEDHLVHRLVARHFLPNPKELPEVNHKDGNKQNNDVSNLEWVSHAENTRHSWRFGLRDSQRESVIASNRRRCSKPVIGIPIDGGPEIHLGAMADATKYGFCRSCISRCLLGQRNSHKGHRWIFAPRP